MDECRFSIAEAKMILEHPKYVHESILNMCSEILRLNEEKKAECLWKEDIHGEKFGWETNCGHDQYFDKPVPEGLEYCCFCGRRIVTVALNDKYDDTEVE